LDSHFEKAAQKAAHSETKSTRIEAHQGLTNAKTPCFQGVLHHQVVEMGFEPTRPLRDFGF
jgi:hypothetical protein